MTQEKKIEMTGFNASTWSWDSMNDIADAGIKKLEDIMENGSNES